MADGEEGKSFKFSDIESRLNEGRDISKSITWVKENKKTVIYLVLFLILLFSTVIRFAPEQQYTGIYEDTLALGDSYWHYRHAKNVYEHGFVGDEELCYNEQTKDTQAYDGSCPDGYEPAYFDTLHDAPFGVKIEQEFYPYFSAYSYKYFGRAFAPNLLVWHRWTPAFFGILSVLGMFLLVKQLFGPYAGLAAGLIFSLAPYTIIKTISGTADTEAVVTFFTIFTFYFFVKAWNLSSFKYAVAGGITLGLFGIAWASYRFAPVLMLAVLFFFFLQKVYPKFKQGRRDIFKLIKEHLTEYWKKYTTFLIILAIGLPIIGFVRGFIHINFFYAITTALKLKTTTAATTVGGEVIRDVYSTITEMKQIGLHTIVTRLHLVPALLCASFFALLPFGLWKKYKDKAPQVLFILVWFAAAVFMTFKATRFIIMLILPVSVLAGTAVGFVISKMRQKKLVFSVVIAVILLIVLFVLPNIPAQQGQPELPQSGVSRNRSYFSTGIEFTSLPKPLLNQNWINFYKWAREQTPEDAIFASWWDHGHLTTAVAERAIVADGSQNNLHIHDLAVILTTNDEDLAVERLKKYNVSYFFTSSDMINKYGLILYLADKQGSEYTLIVNPEIQTTPLGPVLVYTMDEANKITLKQEEDERISATLRQGYQTTPINRTLYYTNNSTPLISESEAEDALDMLIYVLPQWFGIFLLNPEIEKSMLTQLHFFNADYLEHFEFIESFGGEIKVFKVNYD
jgi:dolichyl-diphosphooligosaccharide--protein glycosyltransferase|tara:strand:+ start:22439 stop:24652 length:2214 start_codon:yes stop_codon:yes gene_type:complete